MINLLAATEIDFLVTTHLSDIPTNRPIVMVDGTVPGWYCSPKKGDLHFDHHRSGGEKVQVEEIPEDTRIAENSLIVTTQLDADACVSAAWLILCAGEYQQYFGHSGAIAVRDRLIAIAYDCDHLGLPLEPRWDEYRVFARNVVAAMKQGSEAIASELGLPKKRSDWTDEQRKIFYSEGFRQRTEALVKAAMGEAPWPGERGEADAYWQKFEEQRPFVHRRCKLIDGVAVLDSRGISDYVDPRHLVEWARSQPECTSNITLTVRDRPLQLFYTEKELLLWKEGLEDGPLSWKITLPAYSYTLGSIPLHADGSPEFADQNVFALLSVAENQKRDYLDLPLPSSAWGGRNEVGGSSWNDAALLTPEEVLKVALNILRARRS